jgi:hypothetical protein
MAACLGYLSEITEDKPFPFQNDDSFDSLFQFLEFMSQLSVSIRLSLRKKRVRG